jgi:hypothetical protein
VKDFEWMFSGCVDFNQDLRGWDISSATDISYMLFNVTLSTANYDALLIGWSTLSNEETKIPTNLSFHAGNSKYSSAGQAARNILTGTYGWTITDGGLA